jgi:carbamoyl-phosphate synthase large subunit
MNILLTCVGRRSYMIEYFKEALESKGKGSGKVYAANSIPAAGLIGADRAFIVPSIYAEDYIDTLLSLCKEYDIRAIISLFDLELPILARAAQRFETVGISLIVSSPKVVDICNDKWHTYQFLMSHGFHVPKTYLDFTSAQVALQYGEIKYPVFIKPRWGMGSIAVFEAENEQELLFFYPKVQNAISRTYLATESNHRNESDVIIQEKLKGQEYGLDIVNDLTGKYVTTFVKKKIAMRSGETDAAVTIDDKPLSQLGMRLSKILKHSANLDVDVFVHDERISVLELNPRFGGGYPFSHLAGANIPAAIVAWLNHEQLDPRWLHIDYGVIGYKGIQVMQFQQDGLMKK